jgi:Stage II sporulation protein E (SpoIIE)
VPLSRLKFLFLGVFCLTGMIGCLLDAVVLGSKPFGEVIVWIVFTGIMAVMYVVLALRAPRWLLAGVVFHFVASHFVRFLISRLHLNRPAPDIHSGVRFAAVTSIALCLLSCVFFLLFFYREARHSIRLQTELSLAHDMQKTLVPPLELSSAAWELYGVSLPSDNVGGDLVDLVTQHDGSLLAYIADISGHGLPAGILMGRFKTAVRTCVPENPDLSALMSRLNSVLPQVKEPEMFATCAAVRIPAHPANPISYFEYVLAGHPSPAVFSRSGSVARLEQSSPVLGLLPCPDFPSRKVEVHSGDLLLIFTDGLIEILNAQSEEFGWHRLQTVVEHNRNESLKKIADAIFDEGRRWGNATDDRTLLLLRFS